MSQLLKEWLGSLLKRELSTLLSVRHQGSADSRQAIAVTEKRGKEGVAITIGTETWKSPRLVQLLEFFTFEERIRARVSDSAWTVEAEFRPDAIKSFEASHFHQPITHNTTGGLVQILGRCDIVVRLDSSTATDFLLVIHDCRFRGVGGSGAIGRPRELRSSSPAQELLQALFSSSEQLRIKGTSTSITDVEASSRPCTQANLDGNGERGGGESPKVCVSATQMSLLTQLLPGMEASHASVGLLSIHATSTKTKSQTTTSQLCNDERLGAAVRDKAVENRGNLLNILEKHRTLSECVPQTQCSLKSAKSVSRSSRGSSSLQGSSNEHAAAARSTQAPQPQPSEHGQNSSGELPPEDRLSVTRADTHSERQRNSKGRGTESSSCSVSICAIKEQARLLEAPKATKATNRIEENQKPGEPNRRQSHQSSERDSPKIVATNRITASAGFSPFVFSKDEDPWKGMTRIRKRETRIPKDQQILLESKDSWYPPEPGSRGPVANIPVKHLIRLSKIAERHLHDNVAVEDKVKELARFKDHSERRSSLESASSSAEHDPDHDEPSTQSTAFPWSSSPLRPARYNQLPPDSSAPGIDGGIPSPKGLPRASVFDDGADDGFEDCQPSKRRRTDKAASPISSGTSLEQQQKSSPPNISHLSSYSESFCPEKHPVRQISRNQPQNESEHESHEKSNTSNTNTSTKASGSRKSFPRVIDSGCDVDDSDMESCLPTALGDRVRDASKAETSPSRESCSREKRKPSANNEATSIPRKRIKLEKLYTFSWEKDKQWEDVSSNLHKLKAAFYQQEAAKATPSSPKRTVSNASRVINSKPVSSSSSLILNTPSNTRPTPQDPIPSSPPSAFSGLPPPVADPPSKEVTSYVRHTADPASSHEPVRSRPPSPVLDPPISTQPTTTYAHSDSSPPPSTKGQTDVSSPRSSEHNPNPSPSNQPPTTSPGVFIQKYFPWFANSL